MRWGPKPPKPPQIIKEGGDYILALKGNQGNLHKEVKTFFKQALEQHWSGIDYSYDDGTDAGHYRIEYRDCVGRID